MIPRVSVVMSVHNGAHHLHEALGAIMRQTFADFEFLVVDDGSDDETPQILAAMSDPRLRVVRQERAGLTCSLIKALNLTRGEYVARQDADDLSEPQRLAMEVAFLDSHPEVAIVGSAVSAVNDAGRKLCDWSYPPGHDDLVAELKRLRTPLPHSTVMFRRTAVLGVGGYRAVFRKAQDYDLLLRLAERYRLASLPDQLCRLRLSAGSVTFGDGENEQFYFAVMALVAALIRCQTGRDPLDGPHRDRLIASFDLWYRNSVYPARFLSRLARRRFRIALGQRDLGAALSHLIKATTADPGWVVERWWNRSRQLRQAAAWAHLQLRSET
jgi:glycosyltransferase involved in cell wall biosynthesis